MNRKLYLCLTILFACLLALAACDSPDNSSSTTDANTNSDDDNALISVDNEVDSTVVSVATEQTADNTTSDATVDSSSDGNNPSAIDATPVDVVDATVNDEIIDELSGVVTIWHGWNDDEAVALQNVVRSFQTLHPNVTVDVLPKPFDSLRTAYETAVASGNGPTVLLGAADWGPTLYDAGLVADIGNDISDETVRSINSAALAATQYKGALIGVPHAVKGVVLFRNSELIPTAPTTLSAILTLDQSLWSLERGFFFSAGVLQAQGGQLMDANGNPAFNTAAGVAWLETVNRFNNTEYYGDTDVQRFKRGDLGLIIDGTWNIDELAEAIGPNNLAIDVWPSGLSGFVQTDNIYLSASASGDNRVASTAFIEFVMSETAQGQLINGGHVPAIQNITVENQLLAQTIDAFASGVPFPVVSQMSAYWEPMDAAIQVVYDEGVDPATALQTAFNIISAALSE